MHCWFLQISKLLKDSDQCISNSYLFQLWTFQICNHSWFFGIKLKDIQKCRNILFWNVFIENRMKRVQILPLQLLTNRDILQFWVNTWVNLKPLVGSVQLQHKFYRYFCVSFFCWFYPIRCTNVSGWILSKQLIRLKYTSLLTSSSNVKESFIS